MNDADLARLNVAKRAFEAARPREAEVQTGVRRARLALLRRSKPRRNWLSKGLVLVVLAVGSLAYAKPHALGELVEQVLHAEGPRSSGRSALGSGVALPAVEQARASLGPTASPQSASQAAKDAGEAASISAQTEVVPGDTGSSAVTSQVEDRTSSASEASAEGAAPAPLEGSARAFAGPSEDATSASSKPSPASSGAMGTAAGRARAAVKSAKRKANVAVANKEPDAVSGWGRVGQALARGDEREALVSLNELAESDDPRTRDKADLGRAQLLLAHGNRERACSLARDLTQRHPGERVERQAQALLKACKPRD